MVRVFVKTFEELLRSLNDGCEDLLYEHGFDEEQMRQFMAQLESSRTLKKLGLWSCDLDGQKGVGLCNALRKNDVLSMLDLSTNDLSDDALHLLGEYLRENTSLVRLNLQRNKLNDGRLEPICTALRRNRTLSRLNVSFNPFTYEDAQILSNMLAVNVGLKTLVLRMTIANLGSEGAALIAEGLKHNTTLTDLKLHTNSINCNGAEAIAKALEENTGLTSLYLGTNNIGDKGMRALAQALRSNQSLAILDLESNQGTDGSAKTIYDALRSNEIVREFSMTKNRVSAKWIRRIKQVLLKNREVHEKLFFNALGGSEQKAPWRRMKLMVLGAGGAGKTATIRSLLGHAFNPGGVSTVGVDLSEASISSASKEWLVSSGGSHAVALANRIAWDRFDANRRSRRLSSMRNSVGSRSKGNNDKDLGRQQEQGDPVTRTPEGRRTGRSDLDGYDRRSTRSTVIEKKGFVEPAKRSEEEQRVFNPRLFIGAQSGEAEIKVQIWDYGGQRVFYTLHHLLITRHGVAVLVCSMRDFVNNSHETLSYVEFWMHSVYMHAPDVPVLIAGTFADEAGPDVLRQFNDALCEIQVGGARITPVQNDGELFFPIDNRSGNGVRQMRRSLTRVMHHQPCLEMEVSMQWMRHLDAMLSVDESWIDYTSIRTMLAPRKPISAHEVDEMLGFFHELGMILHFTATSKLKSIVTTRPQWLIDKISLVVRDEARHGHGLDRRTLRVVGLEADAKMLAGRGLASRDLLEFLWEKEQVDFFIELMRSLLLLSAYSYHNADALYLIPSIAMYDRPQSYLRTMTDALFRLISPENEQLSAVVEFAYLPNGVFERLICLCTEYSAMRQGTKEPKLRRDACQVWWDQSNTVQMRKEDSAIRIVVSSEEIASNVVQVVEVMLRKIKNDVMGHAFRWDVKVIEDGHFVDRKELQRPEESVWTVAGEDGVEEDARETQYRLEDFLEIF